MRTGIILGVLVMAICGLIASAGWAAVYNVDCDVVYYGYLNQRSVPEIGGFACAPTSAANALVYLQNKYHSIYGDLLVPWQAKDLDGNKMLNSVDNEIAVVQTLSTDIYMMTQNMHTTNHQYTITGLHDYIEALAPGRSVYSAMDSWAWTFPQRPKPDWVKYNTPTWSYLYDELLKGSAIELQLTWNGGSHAVSAIDFHWNDADNDGIIDFEEGASIGVVDPGTGALCGSHIWTGGASYNPIMELSYNGWSWISSISSVSPVPEPSALLALASGLALLAGFRRRRR